MKVSISLPDDLVLYIDRHVENRSRLIEALLRQWRRKQEEQAMVAACLMLDELKLGWDEECEQSVITDWEASGW